MRIKFLSKEDLKARGVDLNDSTLWRKMKEGKFPKAVLIGNRRGWPEHEIDQYLERLVADRDVVSA
jgi:predicted DNA-binding transcriptional regulator AlpA